MEIIALVLLNEIFSEHEQNSASRTAIDYRPRLQNVCSKSKSPENQGNDSARPFWLLKRLTREEVQTVKNSRLSKIRRMPLRCSNTVNVRDKYTGNCKTTPHIIAILKYQHIFFVFR